jgi:hypothetical protein
VWSWPLLLLAAPAAAEVWSGWVEVARMTGFRIVSPLPGIWSSLRLDTSVTLPVGVECYAAYALRAWLSGSGSVSQQSVMLDLLVSVQHACLVDELQRPPAVSRRPCAQSAARRVGDYVRTERYRGGR